MEDEMIQITDKSHCCGCTACLSICPKQCIAMREDEEGFLYPVVDDPLCIDCGLCEKVCPVLHTDKEREPLEVYAAQNKNEQIRQASSSGGIFTLLAEKVTDEGGVVFGAKFDTDWNVVHDYAETKQGLAAFRGSKYVQSRVGDCYKQVKSFLKAGRKVMFTGTSCQIAGLKHYLGTEYDNLLTVDVVCHGVPSPKVWRLYLDGLLARQGDGKNSVLSHPAKKRKRIGSIEFRSKSNGWKKYSFALTLSVSDGHGVKNTVLLSSLFNENPFMDAFLSNLSLRPSCYACPVKAGKSGSDITIADFWGIEQLLPDFDDDKGTSLVLAFSEKGQQALACLEYDKSEVSYKAALQKNSNMLESVKIPVNRELFFRQLNWKKNFQKAWETCKSRRFDKRVYRFLYRKIGI